MRIFTNKFQIAAVATIICSMSMTTSCKLKSMFQSQANNDSNAANVQESIIVDNDLAIEAEDNDNEAICKDIEARQTSLFDTVKETEYACTDDSECSVLKAFSGCIFAGIAKSDSQTMTKYADLLKEANTNKCELSKCMTLRAFDAVCKEEKCALL